MMPLEERQARAGPSGVWKGAAKSSASSRNTFFSVLRSAARTPSAGYTRRWLRLTCSPRHALAAHRPALVQLAKQHTLLSLTSDLSREQLH